MGKSISITPVASHFGVFRKHYSTRARNPNVTYRYHLDGVILVVIFLFLYIPSYYFCMIDLPEAQLNWGYQLLKLPSLIEKCHFRHFCISWYWLMFRTYCNVIYYMFGVIFKGTLSAFIQALLWICMFSTVVTGALQTFNNNLFAQFPPKPYIFF